MVSQQGSYGYPHVTNPHDFSPDAECCSPEELAAHKRACETWGTPAYEPNKGCYTVLGADGKMAVHVTRTSWGIGVNTVTQCDACGEIANQTIHCWECGGDFCSASCWPRHDAEPECK
jgi:hypothetical protein